MSESQEHHERENTNEPPLDVTDTWECDSDACNGWMRKKFALEESPQCPLCGSHMKSSARKIPALKKRIGNKSIFFGRGLKH